MAKMAKTESYSKATIYQSIDGHYLIDEYDKDAVRTYDITEILRRWQDEEGISLTIKKDYELEPTASGDLS